MLELLNSQVMLDRRRTFMDWALKQAAQQGIRQEIFQAGQMINAGLYQQPQPQEPVQPPGEVKE